MKRLIFIIALVVCILTLFSVVSCSKETEPTVEATLAKQIKLPLGQTAVFKDEGLSLKFVDITDSRCPKGAQCIQAGEARCTIQAKYQGRETEFFMTQGPQDIMNRGTLDVFTVMFRVEPYPEAGKETPKTDYTLTLIVTKPAQ